MIFSWSCNRLLSFVHRVHRFFATTLNGRGNTHAFAVFGDGTARNVDALVFQLFDDFVVRKNGSRQFCVNQLFDAVTDSLGGMSLGISIGCLDGGCEERVRHGTLQNGNSESGGHPRGTPFAGCGPLSKNDKPRPALSQHSGSSRALRLPSGDESSQGRKEHSTKDRRGPRNTAGRQNSPRPLFPLPDRSLRKTGTRSAGIHEVRAMAKKKH